MPSHNNKWATAQTVTHCFIWSQRAELNRRPTDYESDNIEIM